MTTRIHNSLVGSQEYPGGEATSEENSFYDHSCPDRKEKDSALFLKVGILVEKSCDVLLRRVGPAVLGRTYVFHGTTLNHLHVFRTVYGQGSTIRPE